MCIKLNTWAETMASSWGVNQAYRTQVIVQFEVTYLTNSTIPIAY
jgi:hypothetical protein